MPEAYGNESTACIWHLDPKKFRELLKSIKRIADSLPEDSIGHKLIMLDNWNEWDEGHYITPSYEYGFKYLQAVREVLTKMDNLPDYRTPQDLGFCDLNESWKTPDFSDCKKRLDD